MQPDAIVAIERDGELDPVLSAHWPIHTIRLAPSPRARPRSRTQRRAARERAFRRALAGARRLRFRFDELAFQRTDLFTGTPLEGTRAAYAELTAEGPLVVLGSPERAMAEARMLPAGFERNLLCGLTGDKGRGLGLAVLERLDFERLSATLVTSVPRQAVRAVQLGDLYVSPEGRELGPAPRTRF